MAGRATATSGRAVSTVKTAFLPESRRRYPRADLQVSAKLALDGDKTHFFHATLPTANISVGGLFLQSTFFLKLGTRLEVELRLPPQDRVVKVKGTVMRVETAGSDAQTGFAIRFTEYLGDSEVVLATHFLGPVLKAFLLKYTKERRLSASPEYLAHTADVLSAWELHKGQLGGDVWAATREAHQGTAARSR
jgi:hypothetical protein